MKSIGDPTFGYGQNYKPDENYMIRHDDEGNEYKCTWYLVARYYCDRDGTRHRTWTREGYEEMVATAEQQ